MYIYAIMLIYLLVGSLALFRLDDEDFEDMSLTLFIVVILLAPLVILGNTVNEIMGIQQEE